MNKKHFSFTIVILLLMPLLTMAQTSGGYVKRPTKKETKVVKTQHKNTASKTTSASCPDSKHPHWIDLGLPSGTKWSCCNEGALKPEAYGVYFTFEKIPIAPSLTQIQELVKQCTYQWTTQNGVKGGRFTGPNGENIFIPAAGRHLHDDHYSVGEWGNYWSSTAAELSFNSDGAFYGYSKKFSSELPVRPVETTCYYVTFNCNVTTATLYIDENSYTARGTHFLKTGQHSIRLVANGYETISRVIEVNSANTSFSFTMKQEEKKLSPIIQKLVNNMIRVEGGSFTMGASLEQRRDAFDAEKPAHQVRLSSFSIGRYEVTQEEWRAVMGRNPSHFKGDRRPVENVSWNDCQEFIRKLNELTGKCFRLPTEAEWEFAARGGNLSKGYKYAGSNDLDDVAWYTSNSGNTTHAVGQKKANELGLFDMSGNVYEWCQDWLGSYSSASQDNPKGPISGKYRVLHGGSCGINAKFCRSSFRGFEAPLFRADGLGLRLAL